jgi:predicted membrane protein
MRLKRLSVKWFSLAALSWLDPTRFGMQESSLDRLAIFHRVWFLSIQFTYSLTCFPSAWLVKELLVPVVTAFQLSKGLLCVDEIYQ